MAGIVGQSEVPASTTTVCFLQAKLYAAIQNLACSLCVHTNEVLSGGFDTPRKGSFMRPMNGEVFALFNLSFCFLQSKAGRQLFKKT